MAELPPFAAVPPSAVRKIIPNEEWQACLDAWVLLIEIRLRLSDAEFASSISKDTSATSFLGSYFSQLATSDDSALHAGPKARTLRRICFLLTRRSLLDANPAPPELLDWRFLGDFSACYSSSSALKRLLEDTWSKHEDAITSSIDKGKSLIIKQLSVSRPLKDGDTLLDIRRLTIFASCLPAAGHVLIAGSDYLDTLFDAYKEQKSEEIRSILVANAYVGFTSLLKGPKTNMSLLLDQLFSLKAAAGVGQSSSKKEPTLLSDLVCGSDLLIRLERYLSVSPQKRGQDLVSSLRQYQTESKHLHHRYQKHKKKNKGKDRAQDIPSTAEVHVHKMSLITQIQDLFPDLGSGYVLRLLDFYNDDPETIIAHLLDNSLASELQTLDKAEQLPEVQSTGNHDVMAPRPTPPQLHSPPEAAFTRKNVFDNDVDLVELARSGDDKAQKLHFGRANRDLTADAMLSDRSQQTTRKAAILSALATFDSDDDERDDTYDVADVGGTVDSVPAGTDAEADADARNRRSAASDETELSLFRTYKSNPGLFARDSATRRSQPRTQLKRETGMTDEAIEGWAVMLARDPKRLSKLESKMALGASGAGGGAMGQPDLPSTSYRKPRSDDEEDEDETGDGAGPASRGRGGSGRGGRGRGRGGRGRGGRGGGRGGGDVAGPSGDKDTAVARQKKDTNKASRANHNRRDQRAKKIARGGGLPG
ncbi:hypothetical protein Plec18167_006612 [Paecilomyces lecythidis]|uniref:CUE domain-containing protein n=1 Tax=Paecilomyces lecythidis TaxID=3004212 RepID=A0ABR3XA53_9EURO